MIAAAPAPVSGASGVNTLDLVLVAGALLVAVAGARRGLLLSAASALGLIGGIFLGIHLAPPVTRWAVDETGAGPGGVLGRRVLVLLLVAAAAGGTEMMAVRATRQLRERVHRWRAGPLSATAVDSAAGAAFEVVAFLLVAWLIASALATGPVAQWRAQVRGSATLRAVEAVAPDRLRLWSVQLNRLIQRHAMPYFTGPFDAAPVPPASLPAPNRSDSAGALGDAAAAVVRIVGSAPSCGRVSEGSGFVFADQRVMTNAHVVAGTRTQEVDVPGQGRLSGRVVVFDPARDLAVLYVPTLRAAPLAFSTATATTGTAAVVAGYPGGGPFAVVPARVAGQQKVIGPDIYQSHRVTRQVYTLRARLRPGNSGGPLLLDRGRVAGVVFAASADHPDVGYALTATEAAPDVRAGRNATTAVSTRGCN